jgi:transposase
MPYADNQGVRIHYRSREAVPRWCCSMATFNPSRTGSRLVTSHPVLSGLVAKLAEVRRHVTSQIAAIDRDIRHLVHTEPTLKRLMSVPGVGPITALAFLPSVDDPSRFKHARDVGPYLGLTPTRYQSGETDSRDASQSAVTPLPAPASTRRPTCC